MQHDSAPAAANFISLLFIAISLDIEVPWRDSGPLQFRFRLFNALKVRRKGRIECSDTWAWGRLPQRVTVGGKRGSASQCQLPTFEERQHPHKPTP